MVKLKAVRTLGVSHLQVRNTKVQTQRCYKAVRTPRGKRCARQAEKGANTWCKHRFEPTLRRRSDNEDDDDFIVTPVNANDADDDADNADNGVIMMKMMIILIMVRTSHRFRISHPENSQTNKL